MATTEADNKDLIRRFWTEVYEEGNLDFVDEAVAEDCISHSPAFPEDIHGSGEYRDVAAMLRSAFPDLAVTIEDLVAEGNRVAIRSQFTGTHEGEFLDLEPTGNTVDVPAIVIYQIEDGQIVEDWHQADMMGMMEQLGVA